MARKKKYTLIEHLNDLDFNEIWWDGDQGIGQYVSDTYTLTTQEFDQGFFEVNWKGDQWFTLSKYTGEEQEVERAGRNGGHYKMKFKIYKHYKLTDEGINLVKQKFIEREFEKFEKKV